MIVLKVVGTVTMTVWSVLGVYLLACAVEDRRESDRLRRAKQRRPITPDMVDLESGC